MPITLTSRDRPVSGVRPYGAFTMIEVVVSTLIMGVMLVAALSMLASAARSRQIQATQRLGPALVKQWISEILQARYEDIETTLADGTIGGWTREITVHYVTPEDPSVVTGSDRGIKRITVRATAPNGRGVSLVALRSNISIYDWVPSAERTYVSWVGAKLQLGDSAGGEVGSGVNLLNRIPALDQ